MIEAKPAIGHPIFWKENKPANKQKCENENIKEKIRKEDDLYQPWNNHLKLLPDLCVLPIPDPVAPSPGWAGHEPFLHEKLCHYIWSALGTVVHVEMSKS